MLLVYFSSRDAKKCKPTKIKNKRRKIKVKAKKIVALLLAGGMALSLLAGCGSQTTDTPKEESKTETKTSEAAPAKSEEKAEEPTDSEGVTFPLEEPITITALRPLYKITGADYNLFKVMEEETNVHFEFIDVPFSELDEKVNVLLNSGSYPDVMFSAWGNNDEPTKYGQDGVLIPLQDLMEEYSPNYMQVMEERPEIWKASQDENGDVYSYAYVAAPNAAAWAQLNINHEMLEKVGMDLPSSMDDLYEILKAFKEQDADGDGNADNEIPFALGESGYGSFLNYMGIKRNISAFNCTADGDTVAFIPATDTWKELISTLAKWYEEGLINQDWVSLNSDQFNAMAMSDTAIGAYFGNAALTVGSTASGGKAYKYTPIVPFDGGVYPVQGTFSLGRFVITDACEYPEIMVAWIDHFYDQAEFSLMGTMGQEGYSWTRDDQGYWHPTDAYRAGDESLVPGTDGPYMSHPFYDEYRYFDEKETPYDFVLRSMRGEIVETFGDRLYQPVNLIYATGEADELATYYADIEPIVSQFAANVICGKTELDAEYDAFLAELDKAGLEDMLKILETVYARSK